MGLKILAAGGWPLRRFAYRCAAVLLVRPYLGARRVPVVAVTGSGGKTTVTKLIERFLLAGGHRVGSCTTHGVSHGGRPVTSKDEAGAGGAWRAARCPGVQALVLEVARGGLLNFGTGFRNCDVGIVTNVFEDHLGDRGVETIEQMARVKSEIARRTRPGGTLVLNADDSLVRRMAELTRAGKIFFTVEGRESVLERCWFAREGWLWRKDVEGERRFMSFGEIPMTLGGLQRSDVANALAALAALEGLAGRVPVSLEAAARVLREFGRDPHDNPWRNTLLEYRGAHVLVANVKNPESARREAEIFAALRVAGGYDRIVGILSAPGGARADHYRGIARALEPVCDLFFIRAPAPNYRCGMPPERIVEHLAAALPPGAVAPGGDAPLERIIERVGAGDRRTLFILLLAIVEDGPGIESLLDRSRVLSLQKVLGGVGEGGLPAEKCGDQDRLKRKKW